MGCALQLFTNWSVFSPTLDTKYIELAKIPFDIVRA